MNITVVTTMRNEGPFVLEWLAHLRAIGVGHVVVYTNDCEDGTDTLLDTVQQLGWLTHIRQTLAPKDSPQWVALKAAWQLPQVRDADWVMVCDVDEFLEIKVAGGTLPDLIAAVGACDAIALPWRLFGSSGRVTFEDLPVAQQFTQCAIPDLFFPIATTFIKSIFRVNGPFSGLGVHRPKQKNAQRHGVPVWKTPNGNPLPDHFANVQKRLSLLGMEMGRGGAELRHYSLKSVEAFLVKHTRGLPNRARKPLDLTYWVHRNFNSQTVDPLPIAAVEWPAVCLAEHAACVAWYRDKIAQGLQNNDIHQLYCHLILAGDSREVSHGSAQKLYAQYRHIHQQG